MRTFRSAGQDTIQSRVSAPSKRFATVSVIENGSRLPNTEAAVRLRQRFSSQRSNVGYSMSLAKNPSRLLSKASTEKRGPLCRDTTDASGPAASRFFCQNCSFHVSINTATQTRRMSTSPTFAPSHKFLGRVLQTRCCTVHGPPPNRTRKRGCGGTSRSKWSTKTQQQKANAHGYMDTWNRKLLTNTSSLDHVTSMFIRLAVNVNCDHSWYTSS